MKYEKFDLIFYIFIFALLLVLAAVASHGQTSSSGAYTLTKTVVAGGGGDLQENQVKAVNTVGQSVAGRISTGGQFALYSGFWTPDDFAPTAANVIIGGRIRTADGLGIRNVRVTITFPNGLTQTALSTSFGYYHFA